MGRRGSLYSLDKQTAIELKSKPSNDEGVEYLVEVIEETHLDEEGLACYLDSSWDLMHRALADGSLSWDGGSFPLNHVILGGEILFSGSEYIMTLKTPSQVAQIAQAIEGCSEEMFRKGFARIDPNCDEDLTEQGFQYAWEYLVISKPFWEKAAQDQRYVLFAVDQ